MNKNALFAIMVILLHFNIADANDVKVTLERLVPLVGGSSANKDYLQSKGTTINQLGLKYYLGEFQGFYLGILYSQEHSKYLQFTTDSRPFGEFFSDFTSIGPEFGFWVNANEKIRIEFGLSVCSGDFKFGDPETSTIESQNSKKIDAYVGLVSPQAIFGSDLNIDLFANFGMYRVLLDEFTHNNITYSKSELEVKYYFYLSFGLGIRF